jgi:hypothetical protein
MAAAEATIDWGKMNEQIRRRRWRRRRWRRCAILPFNDLGIIYSMEQIWAGGDIIAFGKLPKFVGIFFAPFLLPFNQRVKVFFHFLVGIPVFIGIFPILFETFQLLPTRLPLHSNSPPSPVLSRPPPL